MDADEASDFAGEPCCDDAVRLRRWDDEGKAPDTAVPAFAAYRAMLETLSRDHTASA